MTNLDKWGDRLLDLGKRNRLLNYKDSKTNTLDIILPNIKSIYEKLTDEQKPVEIFDIDNFIKKNKFGKITVPDLTEKVEARIKPTQIFVLNKYSSTTKVIKEISKKSKETILERGINVLYATIGYVWWKENSRSSVYYKAPLILVPITIKNESSLDPYFIEQTEDEVVVNPTLVYKLSSEYNINLPKLEDNVDLDKYLLSVAKVVSTLGWKTTKEMKIGMFSFLKMNMYLDLKNNSNKILQNENVLSLIGDKKLNVSENDIEEAKHKELVLHNVVDADSSQIEAIKLAKQGVSFVLQGPPGTGKSQTITNMIAECLSDNKKVLFVSEKLAALSVVYNNLRKAELDDFCLELHSYKTNKKEVIAELNRILYKPKTTISNKATHELELLQASKQKLDEYTRLLHTTVDTIDVSPYRVFCEVASLEDVKEMEFIVPNIESKGMEHLSRATAVLERYVEYTKSIGNYKKNEWYGYNKTDTSYGYQITLKKHLMLVHSALVELKKLRKEIQTSVAIPIVNIKQMYLIKAIFELVSEMHFAHPNLFDKTYLEKFIVECSNMQRLSAGLISLKADIDNIFEDSVYELDGKALYSRYTKLYNSALRSIKKQFREDNDSIKLCLKDEGFKLNYKKAVELLGMLKDYQQQQASYKESEVVVKGVLGEYYNYYNTNFDYAIKKANEIKNYFSQGIDLSCLSSYSLTKFEELKYSMAIWSKKLEKVLELNEVHFNYIASCFDSDKFNLYQEQLEKVISKISSCNNNINVLENWVLFYKLLEEAKSLDIMSFIEATIDKNVKVETLPRLYSLLFYKQWAYQIFASNELLAEMDRVSHDKCKELFDEKDKLMFEISKAQINAKLSANRPNVESAVLDGDIAVLVREQEKQKHQMPVRVLLNKIPNLIQTLKPCFLMSPLSVSTLLDENIKFDVVIFDEASQIFPEDAIGAIYRAKQVIVVGDAKQMPPSNFFTASIGSDEDYEEDYDEDVEDYESILDICGTTFTQDRLKWHYRSRTEDLIAFSNKNYYNNELVTFPSAKRKEKHFGIDFYYTPKGVFDRKTKTNVIEAETVCELVIENLKKYPERSLGVVAFSQSQQDAIEKIIAKRRDGSKQIDKLFAEDTKEPFFVKNLETVQGDERDTIIFSIGYAKDVTGKFYHNFGPLNRQGGERRLNVAVTRAKYNVQIVSSIKYYDIDLNRTSAEGARLLREYLDYAENNTRELPNKSLAKESDFVNDIYNYLVKAGYQVDKNVGSSRYKIDLAVRLNDKQYALAIECDGEKYLNSKSTRDRDRLREEVLNKLGWKYYRIWSTDWFRNNKVEKKRLINAIKDAIKCPIGEKSEEVNMVPRFNDYQKYDIPTSYLGDYSELIEQVIDKESPISEEWLIKRMVHLFGKSVVTKNIRDEFRVYKLKARNTESKNGFLYKKGQAYFELRVNNKAVGRDIKDIAVEEMASGLDIIIRQNMELSKESLFKIMAKCLGFTRVGDSLLEQLEDALRYLKKSGKITINADRVLLK